RSNEVIDYTLTLSSARLHSLSRWRLNDPRHSQVDGSIVRADGAAISLDSVGELVAQSEIDFRTLKQQLHALLAVHAQCSVAAVLEHYPAEQGLGSVIGYVALGSRHGLLVADRYESVSWRGEDGHVRRARIPLMYFLKEKRDELV
ncbi:MAG: DUF3375 family protein, partial [Rhodanobacter sp.]